MVGYGRLNVKSLEKEHTQNRHEPADDAEEAAHPHLCAQRALDDGDGEREKGSSEHPTLFLFEPQGETAYLSQSASAS